MKTARKGSTPREAEPPGWAAAAPDDSNFQPFSHGDFIGARAGSRPLAELAQTVRKENRVLRADPTVIAYAAGAMGSA
jgi:hypothetical protein